MRVNQLFVVDEITLVLLLLVTSKPSLSIHINEYLKFPVSTLSRLMLAEHVKVILSTPPTSSKSGDIVTEILGALTAKERVN